MMFRKFRIKTRLLLSFFIMAFFTFIVGLTGFARLTAIGNSAVKTIHNVTLLNRIYNYNAAIDSGVYSMVFVSDITISKYVVQTTKENMEGLLKHLNEYLKYQDQFSEIFTPGEMQNMANLLEIYEETYIPVLYEIYDLTDQGRRDEVRSIYVNRFSPIYDTFIYYLNSAFNKNLQYSENNTARNNESASLSANLMLAVVLTSLIVSVMLALAVTKSIAEPLSEVESAAERIANGEIDERSYHSTFEDYNSNDEITHLSKRLRETLLQIAQVQQLKLDAARSHDEKEKAEALARSKGDFLAKMSHEIRTPMNAITGMAELALREHLPDTSREHILTIKQASQNLLSIINDILDFSKIESGKLEIIPVDYLFSSLINDVINIIRTRVIDSNIQFVVNIDSNIPNALLGDEIRVRQTLLNVLSNAVKYTEEGFVSLTVTSNTNSVKTSSGETIENTVNLCIEVADSGKGIKQEDLGKLFGDFVQLDLTKNKGIEGTGLGLAITRNLVKAMGGDVSVNSEYGKGSKFTITLPQKIRSQEKLASVEKPEEKSVLVYEQREIYALSILRSLENLGVKCALAANQRELDEKTENQEWPYVFVSFDLLENTAKTIIKRKPDVKIIALAKFGEVFTNKNLSVLTMPAYSISIANTLNGISSAYSAEKETEVKFTAPDVNILIVDDINTNLKVAEGLLQPYRMKVDLCLSGLEAVRAVKQKYYDIVFMDHMMPEMDGIEATAAIRKLEMRNTVPIIALTANAVVGMREMFIENGFNDFLTKPIDVSKLDEMLDRWIPKEKKIAGNHHTHSPQSPAPQSLPPIPGIDMAKGLAFIGGKEAFYRRVLTLYCNDALERMPRLQTVPEADAMPVFITQVHSLKSASASIGAAEVSAQAAGLEAAGKSGDLAFIKNNLRGFTEHLSELVENIHTALQLDETAASSVPAPLLSTPNSLLSELKTALESQNAVKIDHLMDELNKKPMDSKTKEIMEQVSDKVLMSEFESAVRILEKF
jgi:signal transduction histidine kinase/CheY-like chemotaxis protein